MAVIENSTSNTLVSGTGGDDTIYNSGSQVTIDGGEGNDSISNDGSQSSIEGGAGSDSISNNGSKVKINGGSGDDYISDSGSHATINGGAGNDSILLQNTDILIEYATGDGNDTIVGFDESDALTITSDSYSTTESGNDVIVTVGEGTILLQNAKGKSIDINKKITPNVITLTENNDRFTNELENVVINALGGNDYVKSNFSQVTISGGANKDTISNGGANVSIDSGLGNDDISNTGSQVTIVSGAGNDQIKNRGSNSSIDGSEGNDIISNYSSQVTINSGADNDYIYNTGSQVSIISTSGDNTISNKQTGSQVTVISGAGNDYIYNSGKNSSINSGVGNDTINNHKYGSKVTIDGDAGDNLIYNAGSQVTISAGDGNDTISNSGSKVTIESGAGDDSISNSGSKVTLNVGAGNDSIYSTGSQVSIVGGSGDDSIYSTGSQVSINAGAGNDNIFFNVTGILVEYASGDGNDTIYGFNESDTLTITSDSYSTTESGDDIIVKVGDGEILLKDAKGKSLIINDSIAPNLVTLTENADSITNELKNININALGGNDTISNTGANVSVDGGAGNDLITNSGLNVSINGGAGDDTINSNYYNKYYMTIDGGAGDDLISNFASQSSIFGGAGDDSISNNAQYATINGGVGNDIVTLTSKAKKNLISYEAGDGNDIIYAFNKTSTLSILGNSYSTTKSGADIIVTADDGNITLSGAANLSKLNIKFTDASKESWKISGTTATYGTPKEDFITVTGVKSIKGLSLNDKIVTVSKESLNSTKVTVNDGYSLALADDVTKSTVETKWSLSGTKAAYKQVTTAGYSLADNEINYSNNSTKTLATVKGVASTDGLSVEDNVVTVSKASLGTKKVTISDGYTLKLGDDVINSTTTNTAWTLKKSAATLKSSANTISYTLADDSKSIAYANETTTTNLATVTGVTSTDGLSVEDNVVTISKASLGTKKVTVSDGYTLKLGDDVINSTTTNTAWTLKKSAATYKNSTNTISYTLADDSKSIAYANETTATNLATVKGVKSTDGIKISGTTVKLSGDSLKSKVTVSGGYTFDFASDYTDATITGSSNADTITARGKNISIKSGKGDDAIKIVGSGTVTGGNGADIFAYKSSGKNVITDYATEDKISIMSGTAKVTTSGDNVIFTVGKGKITLEGGADKIISYVDAGGEQTYEGDLHRGVKFNDKGTSATLMANYNKDSFTPNEYSDYANKLVTIDASAVTNPLSITGNKKANVIIGSGDDDYIDGAAGKDKIFGGDGNDTLVGNAGNDSLYGGADYDVFIYNDGDGNDVIMDYEEGDIIHIASGDIKSVSLNGNDYVLSVGKGKITVKATRDKSVLIADAYGNVIQYPEQPVYHSTGGTAVTLTANYTAEQFTPSEYADYNNTLKTIDASAVEHNLTIVGNKLANKIIGTGEDDYIDGAAGKDTIYGGDDDDTLYGGAGDDALYGGDGDDLLWGGADDDTLYGGDGDDTFIYNSGDGKMFIADFDDLDTIMVQTGRVGSYSASSNGNVTFETDNGSGSIVVQNGSNKYIEIVDSSGTLLKYYSPSR